MKPHVVAKLWEILDPKIQIASGLKYCTLPWSVQNRVDLNIV
jgi:hypothetical protein